jgi:hypothetical protein
MTYRLTIWQTSGQRPQEYASCAWDGLQYEAASRHGATMALARTLTRSGAPDGPWAAYGRADGQKRLYGPSLHQLAALTISEGDRGMVRRRWTPGPPDESSTGDTSPE